MDALCAINELSSNNNVFVETLANLTCNILDDDNRYLINEEKEMQKDDEIKEKEEEEELERENLKKYNRSFFKRKRALIETFINSPLQYEKFLSDFEEEFNKYSYLLDKEEEKEEEEEEEEDEEDDEEEFEEDCEDEFEEDCDDECDSEEENIDSNTKNVSSDDERFYIENDSE